MRHYYHASSVYWWWSSHCNSLSTCCYFWVLLLLFLHVIPLFHLCYMPVLMTWRWASFDVAITVQWLEACSRYTCKARRIDGATGGIKDGIAEILFWVVEIGANANSYSWTTIVDRVNISLRYTKQSMHFCLLITFTCFNPTPWQQLAIMRMRAEIATPPSAATI